MMNEHIDDPEHTPVQTEAVEVETPSDSARWLAAISYLFIACLFVIYEAKQRPKDDFVRFHVRQGFALFFVEIVLIVVAMVLSSSLGEIRVLGAIVMILFRLAAGLACVGLSVWGFVEALGGERWHLPLIGEYARRVPLGAHKDATEAPPATED
jgi:uncharacterized membrane protein